MGETPHLDPMNPFEAVKRHDLSVPQSANGDTVVYPAMLRVMGRYSTAVGFVAAALLVVLIVWAFTG